jgi:selenocysteine-specific elongation factor
MALLATAGHVDHGKSALVRALTGMEPDRWAEERRRGMTLDLGFAWTDVGGRRVAVVDVPGHERFVGSTLAGLGPMAGPAPVAGVLLCVAADEGWMPQTAEHAAALAALGLDGVVVAVTRSDLADPAPAAAEAGRRLAELDLAPAVVPVSVVDGTGIPALRAALGELTGRLDAGVGDGLGGKVTGAGPAGAVRLWVDRCFTVAGAGTVVTGTLPAGLLGVGDALEVPGGALGGQRVRVRGLQTCGEPVREVRGPARVAVNLRGVDRRSVRRGDRLAAPGAVAPQRVVTARLRWCPGGIPRHVTVHVGTASRPVTARVRADGTVLLRLRPTDAPLPLAPGDRALLRDPGRHLVLAGVEVVEVVEVVEASDRGRPGGRPIPRRPEEEGAARDAALARLGDWLCAHPLGAPGAEDLRALALSSSDLAAAERAGVALLLHGAVVAPETVERVRDALAGRPGPVAVGEVCRAVGAPRRGVVPVLERLDARHVTRRLPDGRRVLRG